MDGGIGWEMAHTGLWWQLLFSKCLFTSLGLSLFFSPSLSIPVPCSLLLAARLVRTESVPCDINNPLRKPPRYSDLHVSQTLPKTNKLNKVSACCPISDPQQLQRFCSPIVPFCALREGIRLHIPKI